MRPGRAVLLLLLTACSQLRASPSFEAQLCHAAGPEDCDFSQFVCSWTLCSNDTICFTDKDGHNHTRALVLKKQGFVQSRLACGVARNTSHCFTMDYRFNHSAILGGLEMLTVNNESVGDAVALVYSSVWKSFQFGIDTTRNFIIQISTEGTSEISSLMLDNFAYHRRPCSDISTTAADGLTLTTPKVPSSATTIKSNNTQIPGASTQPSPSNASDTTTRPSLPPATSNTSDDPTNPSLSQATLNMTTFTRSTSNATFLVSFSTSDDDDDDDSKSRPTTSSQDATDDTTLQPQATSAKKMNSDLVFIIVSVAVSGVIIAVGVVILVPQLKRKLQMSRVVKGPQLKYQTSQTSLVSHSQRDQSPSFPQAPPGSSLSRKC